MSFRPFNWECPHCGRAQTVVSGKYSEDYHHLHIGENEWGSIALASVSVACANPDCRKLTMVISLRPDVLDQLNHDYNVKWDKSPFFELRILPESSAKPQPDYIPAAIREDYTEACRILTLSPKASATLSRRCIQGMIRNFAGISENTLWLEINFLRKLVDEGKAPIGVTPESVDAIDNVRGIGNIGAHMQKDIDLIVTVEPGEAQLLVELIETLFQDWYVAREKRRERYAALAQVAEEKKVAGVARPKES